MASSGIEKVGKVAPVRGSTFAMLAAIFLSSMKPLGCICYVAANFPSLIQLTSEPSQFVEIYQQLYKAKDLHYL